ncbi:RING finger protein 10-like [Mercenaria mercenaria]|uniref:RING finger protein 10-like n=1 Tax=Mercenaria mercenaria TaxID=6596 RepID=UPI00234F76C2|nr:RING finger protein 10-like [Mercenaria mercenaria]
MYISPGRSNTTLFRYHHKTVRYCSGKLDGGPYVLSVYFRLLYTLRRENNGNDSKKDVASRNQRSGKRRGNFNAGGGNYSFNDGQGRKPTPQKYKNTWDKRPRQRGECSTGNRGDLEEEELGVEFGSAIQAGSKKGNLNHLLNFTYEHEINPGGNRGAGYGGGAHWSRGRQIRYRNAYSRSSKLCYNKEQFLQANCQFVVKDAGDYSVHLMDPDVLVDWDKVEQVRVIGTEPPSCPICLQYPIAAKMTRCGHIYCWACILHYLALGEKTWRKCPICYESVHSDDLKSAVCREVGNFKVGDTITMTLMKKEKGSIYAVPAEFWQKQPGKCHNIQENEDVTRHVKLLTATPDQVLEVVDVEKQQLLMQLVDAESSEEPFIKGAQEQIKARELSLLGISEVHKEVEKAVDKVKRTKSDTDIATRKHSSSVQKIKQYKSAFSDEEDTEEVIQENTASDGQNVQEQSSNQTATSKDGKTSPPMPVSTSPPEQPGTEEFPVGSPEAKAPPIELIPDIMPVEEAAEHLELPTQHGDKTRHKSGDNAFYFYQADDGQHIYIHSLNARCLVKEYGSLEYCPQKITASIVEKEGVFVTEELRKRLRYLSHLPLTCAFDVVELALKPPLIGKETLKHFSDDIDKRRRLRQRRARDDKRMSRKIEEQERKKLGLGTGTIVHSQFQRQLSSSDRHSDTRSDTSSPLLDTPVGSPGLNVTAAEFQPGTSPAEGDEGSQTSTVSFAQMLKAGAKSTVWPKMKSDTATSPVSPQSAPAGSDESDNEDKIPVPKFQSSFGSAIEAAFESIGTKTVTDTSSPQSSGSNPATGGSGKKKKKQLVLFSTSMARGGK